MQFDFTGRTVLLAGSPFVPAVRAAAGLQTAGATVLAAAGYDAAWFDGNDGLGISDPYLAGDGLAGLSGDHAGIDVLLISVSSNPLDHASAGTGRQDFLEVVAGEAWPVISTMLDVREAFGRLPERTVICAGLSASRIDIDLPRTVSGYLGGFPALGGCRVNAIRYMDPRSGNDQAGLDGSAAIVMARFASAYEQVSNAAIALASGLMDGMSGRTIEVDNGATFLASFNYLYSDGYPTARPAPRS